MTLRDALNAIERAYQVFLRTRPITARASGEWTGLKHLIGYPLTNRIPPTPLARRMPFLRDVSSHDWILILTSNYKHLGAVSPSLVFFPSGFKT